jgi:hypothetical protein
MNDRRDPQNPTRSDPAAQVPEAQSRALHRRRSLDEQQRSFQAAYPAPYLFRRRPPG